MKSTFFRTEKPLSDFESANLINVEENYLGLYLPALIDKSTIPHNWYLYYVQAGKTNITVMDKIPARHFAGCLLLEHPYELKGFFSRKKLHSEDYAIIEPVDIKKYMEMESPANFPYEEMVEYGYEWDGMYPMTFSEVQKLSDVPIYVLNPDNTETVIEPDDEIPSDSGVIYGVQKPDWYYHLYRSDDEEIEEEN